MLPWQPSTPTSQPSGTWAMSQELLSVGKELVPRTPPDLLNVELNVAFQAPLSLGFCRQEYWSGLPFPSPGASSRPRD